MPAKDPFSLKCRTVIIQTISHQSQTHSAWISFLISIIQFSQPCKWFPQSQLGGKITPVSGPVSSPYISQKCDGQLGSQLTDPTEAEPGICIKREREGADHAELIFTCGIVGLGKFGQMSCKCVELARYGYPRPLSLASGKLSPIQQCHFRDNINLLELGSVIVNWKDPGGQVVPPLLLGDKTSPRKVKP